MEFLLKAKHWMIFIGLLIVTILGVLSPKTGMVGDLFFIVFYSINVSYYFFVVKELLPYLPKDIKFNYNLFVLNLFISNFLSCLEIVITGQGENLYTGIFGLLNFYILYGFIQSFSQPGILIKSIELNRKPDFGEYLITVLAFVIWPIGIWFIQPRLNKISLLKKQEGFMDSQKIQD